MIKTYGQIEKELKEHEKFIAKGKKVLSKRDTDRLLQSGDIMIKDFYVIWLDPEYPNNGEIMSDIKRKAGEGRLRISSDGAIYKVDCIADWDRRDWDEYEGFLNEDEEDEEDEENEYY